MIFTVMDVLAVAVPRISGGVDGFVALLSLRLDQSS